MAVVAAQTAVARSQSVWASLAAQVAEHPEAAEVSAETSSEPVGLSVKLSVEVSVESEAVQSSEQTMAEHSHMVDEHTMNHDTSSN